VTLNDDTSKTPPSAGFVKGADVSHLLQRYCPITMRIIDWREKMKSFENTEGGRMTAQSVIRMSLVLVLIWQIWFLHVRMGVGWKRIGRKKQGKRRKESREKKKPKPFEGLMRKPVCEQCVAEAEKQEREAKREPPPKIERERGRPLVLWPRDKGRQEIDTSGQFCPEKECRYYGWLDRGNIISNGHPSGGPWRQLQCVVCGKYFQETIGTVFYGSSVPAEDIMRAIATLCEGVSPRKVARIFGVDKDTVLRWLVGLESSLDRGFLV